MIAVIIQRVVRDVADIKDFYTLNFKNLHHDKIESVPLRVDIEPNIRLID